MSKAIPAFNGDDIRDIRRMVSEWKRSRKRNDIVASTKRSSPGLSQILRIGELVGVPTAQGIPGKFWEWEFTETFYEHLEKDIIFMVKDPQIYLRRIPAKADGSHLVPILTIGTPPSFFIPGMCVIATEIYGYLMVFATIYYPEPGRDPFE